MQFSASASGGDAMKRAIGAITAATIEAASTALRVEHELVMTEAKGLTPVDTGALRASGHVDPTTREGDQLISRGGFGGAAAPYAVYVHEDLTARHPVGQAKFYEEPLLAAQAGAADRLAVSIRKDVR